MLTRVGVAFGVVLVVGALTFSAWQHSSPERAQAIDTDGQAWAQDAKGERTLVGWVDLTITEDTSWRREIVRLGQAQAATIARATTQGGVATFDTPGGTVSACVYKARTRRRCRCSRSITR